jgi:hypothetical protein
MRMTKIILSILIMMVVSLAAKAGEDWSLFMTPSGNIACQFRLDADKSIYCVRRDPKTSTASVPILNAAIEMRKGAATTGPYWGDVWYPDEAPKLSYGKSIALTGIQCTSKTTGLVCKRGKHGFSISQKAIKVY